MSGRGSERILDVIEWLAARPGPTSLAELVKALELPKSSALLLLRHLVERRYVQRLEDGRYNLVRLPGEVSEGREAWGTVLRIAEPFVREAVRASRESGFVAVMENSEVRYLNKILPDREVRYDRDISRLRVPHQVASGLVLLADAENGDLEGYMQSQKITGDLRAEIAAMVAKARKDGFYVNLNGVVEGAAGAAAPVVDVDGRVVAAINLSGPKDRFSQHRDEIVEILVTTARRVTEELARRTGNPGKTTGRKDKPCNASPSQSS